MTGCRGDMDSGYGMEKGRPAVLSALITYGVFLVVGLAIYCDGFDSPFYYDSAAKLETRRHLFDQGLASALKVFPQRPLPIISFYLNYLAFGTLSGYYRAVNTAILSASAVTASVLVLQILTLPGIWNRGSPTEKRILSLVLGLIYLVHPLQVFVTLYVWQRMALMAGLFYLASLSAYVSVRSGSFKLEKLGYAMSLFLFICAMLSKENSVTLPVVLVIFEVALFRAKWRDLCVRAAVFGCILAVFLGVSSYIQHPHGDINAANGIVSTLSVYYAESGTTPVRVLLTQAGAMFHYISLMLVPVPEKIQLISPLVVAHSLVDPPITLVSVGGAVALTAAGGLLVRSSPLSGAGILFLVVNLIPEALLAPQYTFLGYRAVLPMFGVLLVVADCIRILLVSVKGPRMKRPAWAGVCAGSIGLALLLGLVTNNKALIWSDRVGFWTDTVKQFPPLSKNMETRSAAQAYSNLGWALCAERRYTEALRYLERARKISPSQAPIQATLAYAHAKAGNSSRAEHFFEKALALNPDLAFAHKELGVLLLREGRVDKARFHLQRALELAPYEKSVREILGRIPAPALR